MKGGVLRCVIETVAPSKLSPLSPLIRDSSETLATTSFLLLISSNKGEIGERGRSVMCH